MCPLNYGIKIENWIQEFTTLERDLDRKNGLLKQQNDIVTQNHVKFKGYK